MPQTTTGFICPQATARGLGATPMLMVDLPAGRYSVSASLHLVFLPPPQGGSRHLSCNLADNQSATVFARANVYLDDSGQAAFNNLPLQALVASPQSHTMVVWCSAVDLVDQAQLGVFAISGNLTALTVDSATIQ